MDLAEKILAEGIVEEYEAKRGDFEKVQKIATDLLKEKIEKNGIPTLSIASRIKEKQSLQEKLFRKHGKYHSLEELTDILGVRIITYFADDIDKIGALVESLFKIDKENSVDKRQEIDATSFGYLSLHYICSLKKKDSEELSSLKFELQIRTGLQHIWADINHDMGYKGTFGVPKQIERQFSKVASLLEIADDEFILIRDGMSNYVEGTREKIALGETGNIQINAITLEEYMAHSKKMKHLLSMIAKIDGAEISPISAETYVAQLAWLDKETLGDIDVMIEQCSHLALEMAKAALKGLELDILSSNVGLRYLCRAELVLGNFTPEQITEFFLLSYETKERAQKQTEQILQWKEKI